MNPGFLIAAIVIIALAAGLIALLNQPIHRVGFWMQDASQAFNARQFKQAAEYYRKIADIVPKFRNPEQRASVEFVAEQGLGICAQKGDDFPTAERHLTRAVELLDRGVEQKRSVVAHLLTALAVTYHAQGKTAQTEQTLQRLREICETADESEVHAVAELVIGAANGAAYRNYKDLAFEIAQIAQKVLEPTEAWHDGSLAHLQITLASFHMLYCECDPARRLIETALESAGDELDRSDAATAHSNLGWILVLSGQLDAAIESFERTLEIQEAENGPDHWKTAIALSALADTCRVKGDYRTAREYSDEMWRMQTAQLSEDDAIRAGAAMTRSLLLIDQGEFHEADRLLAQAAGVADAGSQRSKSASVRLIQGISSLTQLQFDRAEKLLQAARAIAEEVYGIGDRMTCEYLAIQGANLIRMGRSEEAEPILTEALAIRESLTDGSVIDLADLLLILAELYLEMERISAAESNVLRAQDLTEDCVAYTHLIRARIYELLGRIRHAQENFENAIELFREALAVRDEVQPADHPKRVPLLEAYARTLESIGETALAAERRSQAEQIRAKYRDGE